MDGLLDVQARVNRETFQPPWQGDCIQVNQGVWLCVAATGSQCAQNTKCRVLAHGVQHEGGSGSAYCTVGIANGSCVVGWFEDWWTLHRKMDWLISQKLAGIAFFPLGYDNGALVNTAARRFKQLSPTKPN